MDIYFIALPNALHKVCRKKISKVIPKLSLLSSGSQAELIVYQSSRRPSVCPLTLSNMDISATSGPIITKFYLKHHWDVGKAALGFGSDRIKTLVSMATDSSHKVIMGKT